MDNKSLIREWTSYNDSRMVLEYKDNTVTGHKDCYLKGIVIQAEKRNHNERVYPLNEISNAIVTMQKKIENGESILCECDHPDGLNINLDRVAGLVQRVWMEGNNGMAVIKILPTEQGKNIRTLLESGVKLGVSSRGTGNVDDYTGKVSGFDIVTIDIVAQPSAPDAYPKAVFESMYNKSGMKLHENTNHIVTESANTNIADEILRFFSELKTENSK